MPAMVCSISAFFAFSSAFSSATSRPCSSLTCKHRKVSIYAVCRWS